MTLPPYVESSEFTKAFQHAADRIQAHASFDHFDGSGETIVIRCTCVSLANDYGGRVLSIIIEHSMQQLSCHLLYVCFSVIEIKKEEIGKFFDSLISLSAL